MTPFPQYKRGVPRAGLDDLTQFIVALTVAVIPAFLVWMMLGDSGFSTLIMGAVGYGVFKFVAVPTVRYVFDQLPPVYVEHSLKTLMYSGGLVARADPEPTPFQVK